MPSSSRPPRPRTRRRWLSLAITFAAALPIALLFSGAVRRSVHLARLDGAPPQRERALNYVMRESPGDPTLVRAVVERFDDLEPEPLLQAYAALSRSAVARGSAAPARLIHNLQRFDHPDFVRAFGLLDASGAGRDPVLLDRAAHRVARAAPPEADALRRLLEVQGAWSTPPVPAPVYLDWIARRCADGQPALRRHAAGLLATLPASVFATPGAAGRARGLLVGLAADPRPAVRRAALAAAAALHAVDPPAAAIPLRLQTDSDPAVRAAAADLVDLLAGRPVPEPAIPLPPAGLEAVTDANRLAVWRDLVLAPERTAARHARARIAAAPVGDGRPDTPLVYAAAARQGRVDPALLARAYAQGLPEAEWRRLLAQLEGTPPGSVSMRLPASTPHLLRPAAARAAQKPRPEWLRPVLRLKDRPALRADACLVAAQRFDDPTVCSLIDTLLADPAPRVRLGGALIAALRGQRVDALRRRADEDPDPAVRRFARLGLWMQHSLPDLNGKAAGFFMGQPDLPEPLVMLALLHRGVWGPVLDRLNSPDAYTPEQRRQLLGRERFAGVLQQYLPPDAPKLHLWSDGDHFARELDALAAWAAVNRRRGDGGGGGGTQVASQF